MASCLYISLTGMDKEFVGIILQNFLVIRKKKLPEEKEGFHLLEPPSNGSTTSPPSSLAKGKILNYHAHLTGPLLIAEGMAL